MFGFSRQTAVRLFLKSQVALFGASSAWAVAPHALEGCWVGPGRVTLIYQGTQACSRIAVKYEVKADSFSIHALGNDCPAIGQAWDTKSLTRRNDIELWARVGKEDRIVGWLEAGGYWFDEPVAIQQFVEFKGTLSADGARLSWLENFSQAGKNYWLIEAELQRADCASLER